MMKTMTVIKWSLTLGSDNFFVTFVGKDKCVSDMYGPATKTHCSRRMTSSIARIGRELEPPLLQW
jgi:hypothetical protein